MKRVGTTVAIALSLLPVSDFAAPRALPDYRYFRALSLDLLGRAPTRAEISQIERPDFSFDRWIDAHLSDSSYAERIRRIYMDLLRLDLPATVQFEPPSVLLHHARVEGPDGSPIDILYRVGQRRALAAIDGDFCFTGDETGLDAPRARGTSPVLKKVSQALLDARTVVVKPWWLYADYRNATPQDRAAPDWAQRFPGYNLLQRLFVDADGSTPTMAVRVCKEEAQTREQGHVFLTARAVPKKKERPSGRATRLPVDSDFAKSRAGQLVSCLTQSGFQASNECGCGAGLERCLPDAPAGFITPIEFPLGMDHPFTAVGRPAQLWLRTWWDEEARRFIDRVFLEDRDVRELLTSRSTQINGPLAQFYRFMANATCCGRGADLDYSQPEPLFDPSRVPPALIPEQVDTWTTINDRGPRAAGLLTMPVFLTKYGTRRARAHVLYQAFLCRDFVSPNAKLTPSTQADLTKRPGCASCHRTLEPMAAYFTRVQESDWTYLPAAQFPISLDQCVKGDPSKMTMPCKTYYDPAFTDAKHTMLRGAYAAPAHAEAGPIGLATEITSSPEFAPCVVQNVTQSLLGRQLTADDAPWKASLASAFVAGGYRMRSLVRAVVTSPQYKDHNDLKASTR